MPDSAEIVADAAQKLASRAPEITSGSGVGATGLAWLSENPGLVTSLTGLTGATVAVLGLIWMIYRDIKRMRREGL